jgi:hypothetical protein
MSRRELFSHLIQMGGGQVLEDRFVIEPAVFDCFDRSSIRPSATFSAMLEYCQLDTSQPAEHQLAQWMCMLTYGNFGDAKILEEGLPSYVHRVAADYNHVSVYGQSFVPITIMGVSVEILVELLSHRAGWVGRLTTSATKAQDDPLYRVLGTADEREFEMKFINDFLKWRESAIGGNPKESAYGKKESSNRMNLGVKAISLTIGLTLVEWSWILSGRIPKSGNEEEVRDLAHRICCVLRKNEMYRDVIKPPEDYGWDGPIT